MRKSKVHQPQASMSVARRSSLMYTLILGIFALCSSCQLGSNQVHKVLVASPESWDDGDRKSCFLGPAGGPLSRNAPSKPRLPELDCDRFVEGEVIHATPPERIAVLDVTFTGREFPKQSDASESSVTPETSWTCQRQGHTMTCTP